MDRKRAFTLVELLVVVGIVVVLIGILLPALSKARTASRKSVCASHIRGLTQAFHLYVNEWNSLLVVPPPGLDVPMNGWGDPLAPYAKVEAMRQCPEVTTPNPLLLSPGTSTTPWNVATISGSTVTSVQLGAYAFNGWLYKTFFYVPTAQDADDSAFDGDDRVPLNTPWLGVDNFFHLPIAAKESQVPAFADATWSESWPLERDLPFSDLTKGPGNPGGLSEVCIYRHGHAVEVAFLDGHAETSKLADLWTYQWHANWRRPIFLPNVR